jgi:hypothetical protein
MAILKIVVLLPEPDGNPTDWFAFKTKLTELALDWIREEDELEVHLL